MRTGLVACALLVFGLGAAEAQTVALPPTLRCDFEASDGHRLSTDATEPLKAPLVRDVIIAEISLGTSTALQILPTGETPLTAVSSGPDTVHFVETSPMGSLTLTTVFVKTRKEIDAGGFSYPVFRAVVSRHVATLRADGEVSQSYGSCKGIR